MYRFVSSETCLSPILAHSQVTVSNYSMTLTQVCDEGHFLSNGNSDVIRNCVHGQWVPQLEGCSEGK